jgi:regulator of sigma E protease
VTGFESLYTAGSWIFAFVLMLGVLIFVHELGHFLVAKACGVRVLKFSLGFGPPIGIGRFRMRWVRGHTEYVCSWIPLGGFVKMLGESPDETDDAMARAHPSETLGAQALWKKLSVVFAGPAMNLVLPVVVFAGILWAGLPQATNLVGEVESGSPAAMAGLLPGDRITGIDGNPVGWWRDIDDVLKQRDAGSVALEFERGGNTETAHLDIRSRQRSDLFGEDIDVGWLGLYHSKPRAALGIVSRDNAAYPAGLRTGDIVTAVAGRDVDDWYAFQREYAAESGDVALTLQRGEESLEIQVPALGDTASLGVVRADVLITHVSEDSAASEAGLEVGDMIRSVDGVAMHSFDTFAALVRQSRGRPLKMAVARDGETRDYEVAPRLVKTDVTGMGIEVERFRIGIIGNNLLMIVGDSQVEQVRNPLESIPRAFSMTVEITRIFLRGLGKLVTGEVPRDQISGPIGIAEIAGKALERGWMDYLHTLVLISINLGILNLLPIPVLDGGQALVFLVEGVRRAPLSLRTREFVQQIGVTMLIMIMGFAFWNDISRNWSTFVDWIVG